VHRELLTELGQERGGTLGATVADTTHGGGYGRVPRRSRTRCRRRDLLLAALASAAAACGGVQSPTPAVTGHQQQLDQLYADYDRDFLSYLANAAQAVGRPTMVVERLSDRFTVPKRLTVRGTPREIGLTIGHVARQAGHPLPLVSEAGRALNQQIVDLYRRIYPPHLEVVAGIASVSGSSLDQVDMVQMEYEYFVRLWWSLLKYESFVSLTDFGRHGDTSPTTGCSVASFLAGRRHIVGRNFDNASDYPHYLATTQVDGTYKALGHVVYSLTHWAVDGVNERGLSINCATNGEEYFWQEPYPRQPSVFSGHLARIVMDTCASVDEALALIGSVRVWFPNEGLHWLIADASGRAVVVEFDLDRRMVVLDRPGPYELMTNTALQKGDAYVSATCVRFRTAQPRLEAGLAGAADMLDLMRSIRPSSAYPYRTLWTSVMDLSDRSFELHYRLEYDRPYRYVLTGPGASASARVEQASTTARIRLAD
jgi:Linear amide C-N hydrolases, choloylglycine hydrolase family